MRLGYDRLSVVGEKRVLGIRTSLRRVNPFVSNDFGFDLTQASYDLGRALNSATSGGSVAVAEAALVDAQRRLYWNGYSGRSTRVQVDEIRSASIGEIRSEVFASHHARLRKGELAHDILSVDAVEAEVTAIRRLGGSAINALDVRNLREIAIKALFVRLGEKIEAHRNGPKDSQDWPSDVKEYSRLLGFIKEYQIAAQLLGITPVDTQAIVRSFCAAFADRSAKQAFSSAVSMSEATWFLTRWFYEQAAESNISTALSFATRAGIAAPKCVFDAQDLIKRVNADDNYEMAKEAAAREESLFD